MKEISQKFETARSAKAEATLSVSQKMAAQIAEGSFPKGDPFPVARVAAIQAAKRTSELIPYCHPIPMDYVEVSFTSKEQKVTIEVQVKAIAKTGVEMEALTAASVAALTLYDMLKPLGGELVIEEVRLLEKRGGKSSYEAKPQDELKAGVLVFSDAVSSGKKDDRAGNVVKEKLRALGIQILKMEILPDDEARIAEAVKTMCDELKVDLLITSGGTGASPRDVTPEAIVPLLDKRFEGIEEAVRAYGLKRTPYAALSRSVAGTRGKTLLLALPGSSRGVAESLEYLLTWIFHIYRPMRMQRHD